MVPAAAATAAAAAAWQAPSSLLLPAVATAGAAAAAAAAHFCCCRALHELAAGPSATHAGLTARGGGCAATARHVGGSAGVLPAPAQLLQTGRGTAMAGALCLFKHPTTAAPAAHPCSIIAAGRALCITGPAVVAGLVGLPLGGAAVSAHSSAIHSSALHSSVTVAPTKATASTLIVSAGLEVCLGGAVCRRQRAGVLHQPGNAAHDMGPAS